MNQRLYALTILAAALAACSTTPDRNAALDEARTRYQFAQGDLRVTSQAPDEIKRASDAMQKAEKAHTEGDDKVIVDHLAYLASQRVTIAQDTAASNAAEAVTADAGAQRDKAQLALRTKQADKAEQQLVTAKQSNARQTSELAIADAKAQRSDARVSELETQLEGLNARRTDRGMIVTLGDVLFDTGQSRILGDDNERMAKLADIFRQHPQRSATIEGYTDNVGSADSNMSLSRRRAEAVVDALVRMGVPSDRLSTRAHGEAEPTASNATATGRQMNRRVEVVFAIPFEKSSSK